MGVDANVLAREGEPVLQENLFFPGGGNRLGSRWEPRLHSKGGGGTGAQDVAGRAAGEGAEDSTARHGECCSQGAQENSPCHSPSQPVVGGGQGGGGVSDATFHGWVVGTSVGLQNEKSAPLQMMHFDVPSPHRDVAFTVLCAYVEAFNVRVKHPCTGCCGTVHVPLGCMLGLGGRCFHSGSPAVGTGLRVSAMVRRNDCICVPGTHPA